MNSKLRFLLLQVRNANDPMRRQEVNCFARALSCDPKQIDVFDLLSGAPSRGQLHAHDVVLLGGSGHYSVARGGPWLEPALDGMRELVELSKPTFASCWGFQAMARALDGQVVNDLSRAELGTHRVQTTPAARNDPVFSPLGESFLAQMGHEDRVATLPAGAVRLASTDLVENQAFRMAGRPIYCTQFHPELDRKALLERVRAYPEYVEKIAGVDIETFAAQCNETPAAASLLPRFLEEYVA